MAEWTEKYAVAKDQPCTVGQSCFGNKGWREAWRKGEHPL
jgi:hypothetical protein